MTCSYSKIWNKTLLRKSYSVCPASFSNFGSNHMLKLGDSRQKGNAKNCLPCYLYLWEKEEVIQEYSIEVALVNTQCSLCLCLWGHQQSFIWSDMCSFYVEACSWHWNKLRDRQPPHSATKPERQLSLWSSWLRSTDLSNKIENCNKVRGILKWEDCYEFCPGVQ